MRASIPSMIHGAHNYRYMYVLYLSHSLVFYLFLESGISITHLGALIRVFIGSFICSLQIDLIEEAKHWNYPAPETVVKLLQPHCNKIKSPTVYYWLARIAGTIRLPCLSALPACLGHPKLGFLNCSAVELAFLLLLLLPVVHASLSAVFVSSIFNIGSTYSLLCMHSWWGQCKIDGCMVL